MDPSLTIFGVHCSGGQLATLILMEACWVKLFSPPTDKSPDPLPLFAIMVQLVQNTSYALAGGKAHRFIILERLRRRLKKHVLRFISFILTVIGFLAS